MSDILVVEDDEKLSRLIIRELEDEGFRVDHADNGLDGFSLAHKGDYQLLLVDIMIPELDGITLIKKLRQRGLETPILIISAKESVDDRVRALNEGGDDYLTKPFEFAEMIARVQALLRRSRGGGGELTTLNVADLTLDLIKREVSRGGEPLNLQQKEFDLLAYLMQNANKVVSKNMIMEQVWGFKFDPNSNLIESRMSRLRDKVDKPYEHKLIHTIRGAGYVIREQL